MVKDFTMKVLLYQCYQCLLVCNAPGSVQVSMLRQLQRESKLTS